MVSPVKQATTLHGGKILKQALDLARSTVLDPDHQDALNGWLLFHTVSNKPKEELDALKGKEFKAFTGILLEESKDEKNPNVTSSIEKVENAIQAIGRKPENLGAVLRESNVQFVPKKVIPLGPLSPKDAAKQAHAKLKLLQYAARAKIRVDNLEGKEQLEWDIINSFSLEKLKERLALNPAVSSELFEQVGGEIEDLLKAEDVRSEFNKMAQPLLLKALALNITRMKSLNPAEMDDGMREEWVRRMNDLLDQIRNSGMEKEASEEIVSAALTASKKFTQSLPIDDEVNHLITIIDKFAERMQFYPKPEIEQDIQAKPGEKEPTPADINATPMLLTPEAQKDLGKATNAIRKAWNNSKDKDYKNLTDLGIVKGSTNLVEKDEKIQSIALKWQTALVWLIANPKVTSENVKAFDFSKQSVKFKDGKEYLKPHYVEQLTGILDRWIENTEAPVYPGRGGKLSCDAEGNVRLVEAYRGKGIPLPPLAQAIDKEGITDAELATYRLVSVGETPVKPKYKADGKTIDQEATQIIVQQMLKGRGDIDIVLASADGKTTKTLHKVGSALVNDNEKSVHNIYEASMRCRGQAQDAAKQPPLKPQSKGITTGMM